MSLQWSITLGRTANHQTIPTIQSSNHTNPPTIAIHQPNYLPWLGYFYKIYACDLFVFLDDVAYSKGSVTARTYFRKQAGEAKKSYLTVPVKQFPMGTDILDLKIDHTRDWPGQHLNRIENIYRKAPFFGHYFPEFTNWMLAAKDYTKLADWNRFLIEAISRYLGIEERFVAASELPVAGSSTDYLTGLILHLGGERYLSGQGGKKYQDPDLFKEAGIDLSYHNFYQFMAHHPYPQQQGPWLNGLSVLDALMNIGADGILDIFRQYARDKG